MLQKDFIGSADALPEGFAYQPDFLHAEEESVLLKIMAWLPFKEAEYREWQAKRRIVSFGGRYEFTHHELNAAPPIPDFLHALRERIAGWVGISSSTLNHATIAEYRPGTQLGWHRDIPNFEEVMGVSLGGHARMRLRPYPPKRGARSAHVIELAPRSAYAFRGPARWNWQHAISPTKVLRYSITFRTLRRTGSYA